MQTFVDAGYTSGMQRSLGFSFEMNARMHVIVRNRNNSNTVRSGMRSAPAWQLEKRIA
jgi:hypothetical protein